MKSKSKAKIHIAIIILAIIGVIAILDNTVRLSNDIIKTVKNHDWSYIPFKN